MQCRYYRRRRRNESFMSFFIEKIRFRIRFKQDIELDLNKI